MFVVYISGDTPTEILNPTKTEVGFRYLQIPSGYMGGFLVLCKKGHRWVPLQKFVTPLAPALKVPYLHKASLLGVYSTPNFFGTDLPILRRAINQLGYRESPSSREPVNKCHVIKLSGPTDGYMCKMWVPNSFSGCGPWILG